ncbi:putative symporter YjmB [subsurface metagenome]
MSLHDNRDTLCHNSFLKERERKTHMEEKRLSLKVKLGYGVCDLGGNLYFTVIAFWLLNFLTDTVGIAAALAGIVIMIGKIWDAVTDPMVGYLSDRTKTRWGRRRPYIFIGAIPLFLAMVVMFTNPGLSDPTPLIIWAVLAFCLLGTAFTVVNIPYSSLTPELTRDYHERTELNGYRFGFAVVGTLLGAGAALPIVSAFPTKNTGFSVMGTIFGALMMATALITFFSVREPVSREMKPGMGFLKTYLKVFGNRPFVLLLITFALHITAVTVVSGIMVYYYKYIFLREPMTTVALLILLVTAMVFIPVSVLVSKKIGKKPVYGGGMLLIAAACMLIFFLGHILGMNVSFLFVVLAGIGLSTTYVIPWSMIPDTVEYGYLESGERSEGAYYGIWTFITKIGQALAIAISGGILGLAGYIPEVAQSAAARFGIRLLFGPVPALIFAAAAIVLYFYPINETRYQEILSRIKEMEAAQSE